MHTKFLNFIDKTVVIQFSDTDTDTGILREVSDYGVLFEVQNQKGLYFYPWNVIQGIDLSHAYGQMGKVA
jgi:hypothetical protein